MRPIKKSSIQTATGCFVCGDSGGILRLGKFFSDGSVGELFLESPTELFSMNRRFVLVVVISYEVRKSKCPRRTFQSGGDEMGCGSPPRSLPQAGIRRAHWLPAPRRYSPRQAEFSAS